ncbi:hypothetical protein ABVF61_24760 [Roseibium sp. HPY-6]|uniref:hypothetical protein n=1 Tax=Roseibium sp. HPY-6 TaxID=3229852 RepID=UPI00338E9F93
MIYETVSVFAPVILSAICIPFVFRRAGFSGKLLWLTWLPAAVAVFSFLAVMFDERGLLSGPVGNWAIAACLIMLATSDWPAKGDRE